MVTILQHFQKVTTSEENTYCPQQLVAVAKRWNSHMDRLLANHMPYPCIVVTVPEEVALYGNVQQVCRIKLYIFLLPIRKTCLYFVEIIRVSLLLRYLTVHFTALQH